MEEQEITPEDLLHRCTESRALLYHIRKYSLLAKKRASQIGTGKKMTKCGRMKHYRAVRERLSSVYPDIIRLIELWDITCTDIFGSFTKRSSVSSLSIRKELILLNKTVNDMTIASDMGLPARNLNETYETIRSVLIKYLHYWANYIGPIMLMATCFFKFRKQLGYAEQ